MRPQPGGAPVLLIDEIDRTDEPFEAFLLEALSEDERELLLEALAKRESPEEESTPEEEPTPEPARSSPPRPPRPSSWRPFS